MANLPKSYMTSTDLINSIKRKAAIPDSQKVFSPEDFLAFANEEMDQGLVPSILEMHEDYLMYSEDINLTTDTNKYNIPARAIGNKLRDVSYVDHANNIIEMSRIPVDNLSDYNSTYSFYNAYYYYVQNNQIILTTPAEGIQPGKLRMTYYMRPNRLVLLSQVGVITNIDTATNTLTLSSVPTEFSTQEIYDLISIKSPHKTIQMNLVPLSINTLTKTIQFSSLPTGLTTGDHVCIAETCAIPQVPSDLHVVLAQRAANRCLDSLGDMDALQAGNVKLAEYEQKTQILIDDRVEASPLKIINRHGSLRRGIRYRRNRFYRGI